MPAAASALVVMLLLGGCDGIVEKIDEDRAVTGRYEATAPPDSLILRFAPGSAYDETNETPYLRDTTFNLLDLGGRFELELAEGGEATNKGRATAVLTLPDSLYLNAARSYLLTPATTARFDGDYITVIDRVVLNAVDDTTEVDEMMGVPLPQRWSFGRSGRLRAAEDIAVSRPVTRFDTQRGKYVTRNETLGTLFIRITVRKKGGS